jgi:predicted Na+-dependent transporter
MLVQAAMPCGIFTFLIVEMFKGEVMVSLRCSVITMLCCPLVTPVWLYLEPAGWACPERPLLVGPAG